MFSRHGRRLLFTFVQLTEGRSTRNQLARKQLRAKTIFHDRAFPHPHLSSWSSSFPSSSTSRHLFPLSRGLALFLPYLCQFHVPWSSYVSYLFLFAVLGFEFLHCVAIASFDINVWLFDAFRSAGTGVPRESSESPAFSWHVVPKRKSVEGDVEKLVTRVPCFFPNCCFPVS